MKSHSELPLGLSGSPPDSKGTPMRAWRQGTQSEEGSQERGRGGRSWFDAASPGSRQASFHKMSI